MIRIAVFDSGLGSLSIIRAMQKIFKAEIIYFADSQNYPYGIKSHAQLKKIMEKNISLLQKQFSPSFIVVASNTPSLMLNLATKKIVDVKPPLDYAKKISKTKHIAILATESAINSKGLNQHIKKNNFPKFFKIIKINASDLVELVECGKFITDKQFCRKIIKKILDQKIIKGTLENITSKIKEEKITRTAIVIISDVIDPKTYEYSKLYDKKFSHGYRKAKVN